MSSISNISMTTVGLGDNAVDDNASPQQYFELFEKSEAHRMRDQV